MKGYKNLIEGVEKHGRQGRESYMTREMTRSDLWRPRRVERREISGPYDGHSARPFYFGSVKTGATAGTPAFRATACPLNVTHLFGRPLRQELRNFTLTGAAPAR